VSSEAARRPDGEEAVSRSYLYISGACANCDSLALTVRTPLFCSQRCRQAAELVRYVRACRSDGRDQLPDVKEAIRTKMAMVLGGGYPERERQVPPEIWAEVFNRAGGRCESCGRSLDFDRSAGDPDAIPTIQHVFGTSNDVANLKSFCRRCNLDDAESRFVLLVPGSPQEEMAAELVTRWSSIEPLRLCDDERRWESTWSELSRSARVLISSRATTG
jgi:5-methylcytosine-specific restriction endonuclease McrA